MEWQPIETAPKDGSWFHGLVDGDALRMCWHHQFDAFVTSWRRMTWAYGSEEDHAPVKVDPSHWGDIDLPYKMQGPTPLTPPATDAEGEG